MAHIRGAAGTAAGGGSPLSAAAGIGLTGAGAAGIGLAGFGLASQFLASRGRQRGFEQAAGTRGLEAAGFNKQRQAGLESFGRGLIGVGGEQQAAQLQALQGLAGLGGAFDAGAAQGTQDIQTAQGELAGLGPASNVFGGQFGAGAGVQGRIQEQQRPGLEAQQALAVSGLGRIASRREQGRIGRQQGVGLARAGAGLSRLQGMNAINNANISLADLKSNLRFQQANTAAGQSGQSLQAVGGLASQLGGGLLAGGFG